MKRRKGVLLSLLMLLFIAGINIYIYAGGGRSYHYSKEVILPVTTVGDTATTVYMIDFAALDSFTYMDTIFVGPAAAETVVIDWISPPFMMTLTPDTATHGMDSMIYWDTIIFPSTARLGVSWTSPEYTYKITPRAYNGYTYVDTFIYAADTYVISWSRAATNSVAYCCDSAVALINALANLSDSVRAEDSTTYYVVRPIGPSHTWNRPTSIITDTGQTGAVSFATTAAVICSSLAAAINAESDLTDSISAEDSATYVKLISLQGSNDYEGRWTHACTDSTLDTAIHAAVCSTGMVADSMAATFNAEDTLAKYATAHASGDTAWYFTSDDPGLDIALALGDTAQDTSRTQANVTSRSRRYDTLDLMNLINDQHRPAALYGKIILHPSADTGTGNGLGLSDSGWVKFATYMVIDTNKEYHILHADSCASLPCSLAISRIYAAANDSLIKENGALIWGVSDTLSDSIYPAYYRITIDLMVLDH